MSVIVPDFIDAFDARLYFVSSLKKLSVSQQTILKCRSFALRYTDWYEDLYRCIIEVMEGGNIWTRMYLLYFLDSLIERSEFVKFKGYTEFILEDLEKIVGLVCEKPGGSVNLVNTLKTLERWQTKNFFNYDVLEKSKALLLAWKSEPEYPPELNLTATEIKQRMEDDRERAKLLREDSWWVDKSIEDGEALTLWEETSDLDDGDYIDIVTENIKQDPNYDWKSLYEEVTAWNKKYPELKGEGISAISRDFEPETQPVKNIILSKVPKPTQEGLENFEKYKDQVFRNAEVPSKISRPMRESLDIPIKDLVEPLEKGDLYKVKEELPDFESTSADRSIFTPVATPITNLVPIARNGPKVPAIVISPPNQELMLTSPCPEKSGIKKRHGTDDIVPDERFKPKRARKRMPPRENTSGIKEPDSQELSDQNSSYESEDDNIRDSEEADRENSNNVTDHLFESNLEFLLQAVELVSPMTEVSLSKEDSPSRDDFHLTL